MRPGCAADHSPPSSAAVMEEQSHKSTHSLGHTGPVMGSLYLTSTRTRFPEICHRIFRYLDISFRQCAPSVYGLCVKIRLFPTNDSFCCLVMYKSANTGSNQLKLASLLLSYFPHYHIKGTICEKKSYWTHKLCVLNFSTNFSEIFLIPRIIERDIVKTH